MLVAYEYRCGVCGYDGWLGREAVGLDAAHVRWWAFDGPDTVDNGVSLCALHHKLFDRGVIGISDERTVRVSQPFVGRGSRRRRSCCHSSIARSSVRRRSPGLSRPSTYRFLTTPGAVRPAIGLRQAEASSHGRRRDEAEADERSAESDVQQEVGHVLPEDRVRRFLERDIWPQVPPEEVGRRLTAGEEDAILGFGPDGT